MSSSVTSLQKPNPETLRQKRLNYFETKNEALQESGKENNESEVTKNTTDHSLPSNGIDEDSTTTNGNVLWIVNYIDGDTQMYYKACGSFLSGTEMTEEEMLEAAIKMSMDTS